MSTLYERQQLIDKFFQVGMLTHLTTPHGRGQNALRGQGKILLVLSDHNNISQKELSEYLGMTPQSTAEFVTKLVKKGLVAKNKSPEDGRISLITLTDAGRANITDLEQDIPSGLQYLTDEEEAQLLTLLTKLVEGMRADFDNADQSNGVFASVQRKMAEHMINEHLPKNDKD
ncbi:MarR family transcriptional regulator [Periweissella cryptocerci]|uniref:MarR family transcriptional regulator n=1 Tax=Periweissella cryptocerci TaxID=2506420 RepID=A0A4P6YTV3_9LACO|nr:MarR family transcriptional regulator [Periweissella cryptocerci]QBO36199.1 MarR family transcriptional regulator [Periweissella cryptocerci]